MWKMVDLDKVIRFQENKIFIGGHEITDIQLSNLQNEIQLLKQTFLWSILTNTLNEQAQRMMFEKSLSFQDMTNGKMILYTIDVQEKIIEAIEKVDRSG